MTALSPSQAAFGRDVLFDYPSNVDWWQQQQRKQLQLERANQRENANRDEHEYQPEDWVMVARNDPRSPKLQTKFGGPYQVFAVRENGVLMINTGKYVEGIHMRRVKPFKTSTKVEDVVLS
ncbi:hypothetical protein PI124_g16097 [Phytophthora idaei]|nr:hypothetical protein PI125_g15247 [Phytophthora idaei]KAG3144462.1 hypothetical protein PI126_g14154 [Phytophthora idaei]KAG3238955.1 hypothetical protein PI124_g16097 [Phytophthora idaei]